VLAGPPAEVPAATTASTTASTTTSTPASSNGESAHVRRIDSAPSAPVDLMSTAGAPVAKRIAPIVALLFLATWLLRRRRKRRDRD